MDGAARNGIEALTEIGRPLFYMSFTDGQTWLGALILPVASLREGLIVAHLLDLNPGGEVAACAFPPDKPRPPDEFIGRLLDRDDIATLDLALDQALH